MGNQKLLYIVLGIIAIGAIGFFTRSQITTDEGKTVHVSKASDREIASHYVEYSQDNLAKAKENGRAVLYFWAAWCPTCRELDKEG